MKGITRIGLGVFLVLAVFGGVVYAQTEISSWADLHKVRNDLSGNYVLTADLNSASAGYSAYAGTAAGDGTGWLPIGTDAEGFTGSFDGSAHTISDLHINRSGETHVGLFGNVGSSGLIKNVRLSGINITGGDRVGGLIGRNLGAVSNSRADGSVEGKSDYAGGLIGFNAGNVSNSSSAGNVAGLGTRVGGLIGFNHGAVKNSSSAATVSGGSYTGGLIGLNSGNVSGSHSAGNVAGLGARVGGLIGFNDSLASVSSSYAEGGVAGEESVGGLIGRNAGAVSTSYSTGSVESEADFAGGLVGYNRGYVLNSYSTGNTVSREGWGAGGLIGFSAGRVINSYSAGRVQGKVRAGGLIGRDLLGIIENSFWNTETSGMAATRFSFGEGRTTAQMRDIETFLDWEIALAGVRTDEIWHIEDGEDYPRHGRD